MNLKEQVQKYLEDVPPARERSKKDRALVNILKMQNPLLQKCIDADFLTNEMLVTMVQNYDSMNRSWRQILRDTPALRGSDYEDAERLSQEAQISLGYGK